MKTKLLRRSTLHSWLIRLLFYGLFLAGPCFLSEAHTVHVRMKHEYSLTEDVNARKNIHDKYHARERLLTVLGFSCIGTWLAWLAVALVMKTLQAINQRRRIMPEFKSKEWMYSSNIAISCVDSYLQDLSDAGEGSFVVLDEEKITELSGSAGGGINPGIIAGKVAHYKESVLSANSSLSAVPTCLLLTYRQFCNGDVGLQETWNRRGSDNHGCPCIKHDPGVLSISLTNCVNLHYNHADLSPSRYEFDLDAYQDHYENVQIGKVYKKEDVSGNEDLEYWKDKADQGWERIQAYLKSGREIK